MAFGRVSMAAKFAGLFVGCETLPGRPGTAAASPPTSPASVPATTPPSNAPPADVAATMNGNEGAGSALTPEMCAALRQLSAEDFSTRQAAAAQLQEALAKNFRQMLQVQDLMLKIQ